ncbi:MAG: hypothetical protein U9R27_03370 [Campylobacterota bacterium]|nr:hypothetical protein [Campylobacterota bacterium]
MKNIIILLLSISIVVAKDDFKRYYFQSKSPTYQSINDREYQTAIKLFGVLFQNRQLNLNEKRMLHSIGLKTLLSDDEKMLLSDDEENGRGLYMIRYAKNRTPKNMISIPHRFYDIGTGVIGYQLMQEHSYRAIAFNTVHRKVMDAAHTPQTLFNAFHVAFAKHYADENIYQLHGFSHKKRKLTSRKIGEAIVSSASITPTKQAKNIDECLHAQGIDSLLYGRDIFELGGETNTQAETLRAYGFDNFIHIEMSSLLRKRLKESSVARQQIIECLP